VTRGGLGIGCLLLLSGCWLAVDIGGPANPPDGGPLGSLDGAVPGRLDGGATGASDGAAPPPDGDALDGAAGRDGGPRDAGPLRPVPTCRFGRARGPVGGSTSCPAPIALAPDRRFAYRGTCDGIQTISLPPDVLYFLRETTPLSPPNALIVEEDRIISVSDEEPFVAVLTSGAEGPPSLLGRNDDSSIERIDLLGDRLVGVATPQSTGFLFVFDLADPTAIQRLGEITLATPPADVAYLDEDTVWVLLRGEDAMPPAIVTFDVGDPSAITEGIRLELDRDYEALDRAAADLFVAGALDGAESFRVGAGGAPERLARLDLPRAATADILGDGFLSLYAQGNTLRVYALDRPMPPLAGSGAVLQDIVRLDRVERRVALSAFQGAFITELLCEDPNADAGR
jgi:hypothetical protein